MTSQQMPVHDEALPSYSVRNFDWLEGVFFFVISVWALSVFSAWLPIQLLYSDAGAYMLPLETSEGLNVLTGWLPLANSVSEGNLLPILSATGGNKTGLEFYPYLTLWLNGALIALFGIMGSALIGEVVLPAASLVLFVLVLRQFIPRRWAISLASLGFLATTSFPLRDFLAALFGGLGWRDLGIVSHLDIAHFPIPALSVFCFLLVLKVSMSRRKLSIGRMTFLTALWALLSQIHPVDAVVGLVFWFFYFPLDLIRQNRSRQMSWVVLQVSLQLGVAILICAPAIYTYLNSQYTTANNLNFANNDQNFSVDAYYLGIYFLLPILMTICLFVVLRVDKYEILTRFRPIYTMMATELLIIILDIGFGAGIPAENLYSRLGIYVLHPLYFVPVVYLFCRASNSHLSLTYSTGTESVRLAGSIRWYVDWLANEASKIYLPLLLVILTFYAMSSARQEFHFAQVWRADWAAEIEEQINSIRQHAEPGDVVATANPLANVYLPVLSGFGTIWAKSFSNKLPEDEIVGRFALYAHLSGWSIDHFQTFMAPGGPQLQKSVRAGASGPPESLGYWYVYQHRMPTGAAAVRAHKQKMKMTYDQVDVASDIRRFKLRFWLGASLKTRDLPVVAVHNTKAGTLYEYAVGKRNQAK
jgi:hypothetical protein